MKTETCKFILFQCLLTSSTKCHQNRPLQCALRRFKFAAILRHGVLCGHLISEISFYYTTMTSVTISIGSV